MNKRRRIWAVILMAVMLLGYMPGSRTGAFYASAAETVSTESSLAAQRAAGDTAEPPVKNADAASGQSLETDSEKPPEKIEETDSEKTSEKTTEMDSEKESGKSTEAHSENAAEKAAGAAPEKSDGKTTETNTEKVSERVTEAGTGQNQNVRQSAPETAGTETAAEASLDQADEERRTATILFQDEEGNKIKYSTIHYSAICGDADTVDGSFWWRSNNSKNSVNLKTNSSYQIKLKEDHGGFLTVSSLNLNGTPTKGDSFTVPEGSGEYVVTCTLSKFANFTAKDQDGNHVPGLEIAISYSGNPEEKHFTSSETGAIRVPLLAGNKANWKITKLPEGYIVATGPKSGAFAAATFGNIEITLTEGSYVPVKADWQGVGDERPRSIYLVINDLDGNEICHVILNPANGWEEASTLTSVSIDNIDIANLQVKYTKLPDNITFTAGFLTGDDGKKSLVLSMKYKDRAEEKTDPNDKPIVGSVNLGTGKFAKNTTFKFELTGDPGAPMPEGAVGNVYTYTLEAGDAEKQKSISFAAPVFTTPTPLDQYYIYTLSMKDDLDSLYEADTTRYLIRYTVTRNNGKIDYSYNVLKKDGDGKKQSGGCVFNVKPKVTTLTVTVSYKDDFTGIDNKGKTATVQAQRKTQSGGWEAVPGDGYNKDISRTTTSSGDGKADSTGDKYAFDNLPVCDDEGNLYQYRAIETAVTLEDDSRKTATGNEATDAAPAGKAGGYSYTSKHDGEWKNGFTSAIHNVIPTGIIKAVKAWEDKDSSGRPASITLRLQRKGEGEDSSFQDVETKTLNVKAGETTATWEGVPAVNTAGDSYTCRIAEDPVKGYSSKSAPAEAKVRENETTTVTVKNTAEEPETPGPETDKPAQPETPSPETAAPQDETDAPVPQTEAPKKKETEKKETEKKETEKKTPPAETPEQIAEKAAEIAGRITGIKGAYRVPADKLTEEEKKVLTAAGYRLMDTDGDGTLDTYVLGAARTGDETPVLPYTYALLAAAALIAAVMRSRKSIFRS